ALALGGEDVRVGRLLERNDPREARLDRLDLRGAEMLADQDREAGEQLRAYRLAHQRVVMSPVEHALRIEPGVVRVPDMEDVLPRDQHIVEHDGGIELIALRGERMLDRVARDQAFAADDRDARKIRRANAIDDLVALGAGTKEHAKMQEVGERRRGTDRLDAIDP